MSHVVENSEPAGRQLIAFRVGEQEFCVDIASVREIRGWTLATPLPRSPAYVRGVINLRGAVLPIIDMAARLGLPEAPASARQVVIVVWIGGQLVGLLVDAVSDILSVPDDSFQATPEMAADAAESFVSRLITLDDRLIGLVTLEALAPAAEAA